MHRYQTMHQCGNYHKLPCTRRDMLARCAAGFGSIALTGLMSDRAFGGLFDRTLQSPHHAARARNVIFLYMDGAPSQVDTFDTKPRLARLHGQPFPMEIARTQFNNIGNVLASPWKFRQHGDSGAWVSELFPHTATCVDELCIIRSMTSEFSEHTNANYFLHTGLGLAGRPSMGAWASYGLGSQNSNLPGFVVLNGGLTPPGGLECFGNGFLPATHQGTIIQPQGVGMANTVPPDGDHARLEQRHALVRTMDKRYSAARKEDDAVESAIANHELAFRMQWSVPELMELERESTATRELYGLDAPFEATRIFARECLLARRLVERGVRFVELTCPDVGSDRWDSHGNLYKNHTKNALAVDQPIAGLLKDLRSHGLLDETLVIWGGEFGRTPFSQGTNGRDHNPFGFTMWMAGGGVRPGITYGRTDELGYRAIEHPLSIHDLHATMLHLLGIDHTRLTIRHGGRDMRLTDVHGHIVSAVLA